MRYVASRYPVWDDPDLIARIDAARFYLPDAPEGQRESLITTVIDAHPQHIRRVTGPSWLPIIAVALTGDAFIFPTFHIYWPAALCGAAALATII